MYSHSLRASTKHFLAPWRFSTSTAHSGASATGAEPRRFPETMPFPTANASLTSCLPWPGSPSHRCSRQDTNAPAPGGTAPSLRNHPGSENRTSPGTARPRGSDLPVPAPQPRPEHLAPSCSPRESRAARGPPSAAPLRPAAGGPCGSVLRVILPLCLLLTSRPQIFLLPLGR